VTLDQEFSIDPFENPAIKKLPGETSHYPIERKVVDNRIEEIRRFSWNVVGVSTGIVDLSNTLELSVLSRNTSLFFSRPKRTSFSLPVTGSQVTVKALPTAGRPANFSGAVGLFSLKAEVTPKEAAPGDVVRIRTEVTGAGLLDNANPPLLNSIEGLKVYDPRRIEDDVAMVYEQQVVPQTASALTIPEIRFIYFDPVAEAYKTLRAGPFKIVLRERSAADDTQFRPDDEEKEAPGTLPSPPLSSRASMYALVCAAISLLTALLALKRARRVAVVISCIAGLTLILTLTYIGLEKSGYFAKDTYKLEASQAGFVAPSGASVQTVTIPSGGHVLLIFCQDGWALVSYSGRQCWIPESKLGPLTKTSKE
jgi:hypothetical protein